MAYTTINKSSDYFNTKLYTGTGSSNAITGVGFQPDWVWIKNRSTTHDHILTDAVRGVTKDIRSNNTDAEATDAQGLTAFGTDGFTVGTKANINTNGSNIVSWNWKANGQGSSNTDGSISSTVSANTTAGFSIVKYTGTGTNSDTVGHGLGTTPSMIIAKGLDSREWYVQHQAISSGTLNLESTGAATTNFSSGWINESPTNSVFSFTVGSGGTTNNVNNSGTDFIAYCFKDVQGYSKFGSYTGNGNADGTFVYTGFKPAFVIIKRTSSTDNWLMWDNKRNTFNATVNTLRPNTSEVENTSAYPIDFLSNGFKNRGTSGHHNTSGNNYIYMAFAEAPLVGSNNVPCTAR